MGFVAWFCLGSDVGEMHHWPLFPTPPSPTPLDTCFLLRLLQRHSHFFASALFTLFKILPFFSPFNILSFLSFLCLDQFSFLCSCPFSQPLYSPHLSSAATPTRLCWAFAPPVLHSSSCLCWQSGRRRRLEAELAALAPYIIHVPCSLYVSWSCAGFSSGTHGPRERALCVGHKAYHLIDFCVL